MKNCCLHWLTQQVVRLANSIHFNLNFCFNFCTSLLPKEGQQPYAFCILMRAASHVRKFITLERCCWFEAVEPLLVEISVLAHCLSYGKAKG
eukprot:6206789-Pleurochrysis_carterae.AAC.8